MNIPCRPSLIPVWPKRKTRASGWQSCAIIALSALSPFVLHATEAESTPNRAGENRWVPSFAITAGFTGQKEQTGFGASSIKEGANPTFSPLREPVVGDDTAVTPFVGGAFELMTPTLPITTRPRFFVGAEILPTFAPGRDVAGQGDPGCVRGPEPKSVCAVDEDGSRRRPFGETAANGTGTRVEARIGTMVYGAHIGVAFPFEFVERQFRVKPSFGWINFKVSGLGVVVDAACDPESACTPFTPILGQPPDPGFLREVQISVRNSQRLNGIGPGLDLEMDTGQFGPFGVSLFIGGRAYIILDDRKISFEGSQTFNDQIGNDEVVGRFEIEIDQWMYRAHVGIRFQFIGFQH